MIELVSGPLFMELQDLKHRRCSLLIAMSQLVDMHTGGSSSHNSGVH